MDDDDDDDDIAEAEEADVNLSQESAPSGLEGNRHSWVQQRSWRKDDDDFDHIIDDFEKIQLSNMRAFGAPSRRQGAPLACIFVSWICQE